MADLLVSKRVNFDSELRASDSFGSSVESILYELLILYASPVALGHCLKDVS
jgi:hypothetical protein